MPSGLTARPSVVITNVAVQSLSHVLFFVAPVTAAFQASLSLPGHQQQACNSGDGSSLRGSPQSPSSLGTCSWPLLFSTLPCSVPCRSHLRSTRACTSMSWRPPRTLPSRRKKSWTSRAGSPSWPCSMWALSSLTRDRTHAACTGRQLLNPWTTREVPQLEF